MSRENSDSQRRRKSRRAREKAKRRASFACLLLALGLLLFLLPFLGERVKELHARLQGETPPAEAFLNSQNGKSDYPQELVELLEKNEEAFDFVQDYPNRADYQGKAIDLSGAYQRGQVPLLMQWDKRWGYDSYGGSMIALSGCGPTCMSMVYIYLTGDITMNPREMAAFAEQNGYCADGGTSWSLWTEGAAKLGLAGQELPLSEKAMKQALDEGGLIVCSMRPGDFTTTGHFIVLRGYDKQGFFVNDPNRRSTSERQWDYDTLQGQIKNLWGIFR